MNKELNLKCNYSAPRELVNRDSFPMYPLKNAENSYGQLSIEDIALLDKYSDLIYKTKRPLSLLMLERKEGLPTFNQFKLLIDEKCKEDGTAFYDRLKEIEEEIIWGSLWNDVVDEDEMYEVKKKAILMNLLGKKMGLVEQNRDTYNVQINNYNEIRNASTDVLKKAEEMLSVGS